MSMIGNFLLVSDQELTSLLNDPATVHALLDARVYEADPAVDYVDVDKAWHAIHFMLTGSAWDECPPLDFIAVGGTPIGDEDVGYGPARALDSNALRTLSQALEPITPEVLLKAYDCAKMDGLEIYPSGGWVSDAPKPGEDMGYFTGAFSDVRSLVQKGAREGRGMLIWIS